MQNRTLTKRAAALMLALLTCVTVFAGCGKDKSGGDSSGDKKTVAVTVTHKDGSTKDFTYETAEEMLGKALADEGLIEGEEGQYGLFVTTVDGYKADDSNQEWWCLTVDGESAMTGIDSTPIEEGKKYGLTLTVGY